MNRILVIGAGGLVGSRFMEMVKDSYDVYGTFNSHQIKKENCFFLNAVNRKETFNLIAKVRPDLVIDTHSLNNVDYCETHREESWSINVDGARNLAEACKDYGAKIVFFSSDYVFDGKKMKYSEKDKPKPLNYLGANKLIVEEMLYALNLNYIVARTSVVYGIGGLNKVNFVKWLVQKLTDKQKVSIVTDQKNNPTFADNIVNQIMALYKKNKIGLFHLTGSECLSRYEFAMKIGEIFNLDTNLITPITTVDLRQIALRPMVVNMSVSKLEKETGILQYNVENGLREYKKQLENKSEL